MKTLKTGDTVKVISGDFKGETAKIVSVKDGKAILENLNIRERHYAKSMFRPQGGSKTIQVGFPLSKLKLEKAAETKKAAKKSAKKSEKSAKGAEK